MDIQTRTPGAAGSFSRVSTANPSWLEQNRPLAIRLSVIGVAVILVVIAASIWAGNQSQKAQVAFSNAMDVYDAPIQQPGQPPVPNVKMYASSASRSRDAHPLFQAVAEKYGVFKAGKNARYFAGLTAEDTGDNAQAEADLKKAAGSSDSGLAALAKMALASLYQNTGRAPQAADIYRKLIENPTVTVSANAARLAFAAAQQSTNPQAARELYAKIKDTDKTTAAGQIAAQKLGGK